MEDVDTVSLEQSLTFLLEPKHGEGRPKHSPKDGIADACICSEGKSEDIATVEPALCRSPTITYPDSVVQRYE